MLSHLNFLKIVRWGVIGVQLVLLKTNPTWSNKMSSKIAKQMIAMINTEEDFMFVVLNLTSSPP